MSSMFDPSSVVTMTGQRAGSKHRFPVARQTIRSESESEAGPNTNSGAHKLSSLGEDNEGGRDRDEKRRGDADHGREAERRDHAVGRDSGGRR